jgi:magnesium transporter
MLAALDQTLDEISRRDFFALHCFTDRQDAANELAKRKFFAAPIVDSVNHILGIVKAERMIQGVQEEIIRDIQQMFGAGADERVFSTILYTCRSVGSIHSADYEEDRHRPDAKFKHYFDHRD